jgi:cytochrome c oxidase subunit 3
MTEVPHGSGAPAPAVHKDYEAAKIGMWLFLFTEILLFGGLFILYAAYRSRYPKDFHEGGQHLNFVIGVVNTVVLLTSSLAMAVSITAIRKDDRKLAVRTLVAVIALGCLFLVNKAFEWGGEYRQGIFPKQPVLSAKPPGEQMFFGLYFTMTGLHGLHVIAGIAVLSVMLVLLRKGKIGRGSFVKLENAGLYWHLVDVIWIYLLPLFYLAA